LKPLKVETAFSTPWFDLLAKTMQPDEAPYYSLRLPDYAAIIAITDDQRVLAVRQYRPAVERFALEFPSGIVDPGESPDAAALRELREETGYEAGELEPLGPMTIDNGRMTNRIWHFAARGLRRVGNWIPEEGIEQLSFSLPELREAIVRGEFDHALHIAGFLQAVLAGKVTLQV
jgi:ADP-ribose pyrophosphatase